MRKKPAAAPPQPFRGSTRVCGWVAVSVGVIVVFGGWMLDVPALTNLVPGTVSVKASTAFCLGCLGAALLLLDGTNGHRPRRMAGLGFAGFALVAGLAFLSEYVMGRHLGIDELPFRDQAGRDLGVQFPGRPAPTTGINFVLAGLALLALDARPRRGWRPAELLVVPVALVASMSLIGYTYGIEEFYGPGSAAKMAVTTALAFIAIALGVALSRPHGRLLALATTTAPGGQMARRLLPVVVVFPLVLGWLRLAASDAGLFGDRVGTWWLTATTIAGMFVLLWRGAVRLNDADVGRRTLEDQLYDLANYDEMTGLFNRRRFEAEMTQHVARVRRHGGSTSVIELDLDSLKRVNDELGHAAGDTLITGVAKAISQRARGADVTGRLGGDEFAVLLVDTTRDGAMRLACDLQASICAAQPDSVADRAWSTVSIGVSHSDEAPVDDGLDLLANADHAMYVAKKAGGDRIGGEWFATRRSRPHAEPTEDAAQVT